MYLGAMTKTLDAEAKIAAAIDAHLQDHRLGRRSARWLSEQTGIPRNRVTDPAKLTMSELIRIADAFGIGLEDLYRADAA